MEGLIMGLMEIIFIFLLLIVIAIVIVSSLTKLVERRPFIAAMVTFIMLLIMIVAI